MAGDVVGQLIVGGIQMVLEGASACAQANDRCSDCPNCGNGAKKRNCLADSGPVEPSRLGLAALIAAGLFPVGVLAACVVSPDFLEWMRSFAMIHP